MNENELQINQVYFSKSQGRLVKYLGLQTYEGKVYHNFYEPVMRLFHWLNPQDINLPNKACSGFAGTAPLEDEVASPANH